MKNTTHDLRTPTFRDRSLLSYFLDECKNI